jgi:monoterpene epsilon-lactone hydrolase
MRGMSVAQAPGESVVIHALEPGDAVAVKAMRPFMGRGKGVPLGVEARGQYDALTGSIPAHDDVTYEAGSCGGILGLWVLPVEWHPDVAMVHLHGGWFGFGSAVGYAHLVSQIAARTKARTFVPDYRLAPEHPFPAATEDALACYRGLSKLGIRKVALTGDSAGGNLALGLAARVADDVSDTNINLVGVVALSPVTDLSLSGESYETRAEADPLFTRAQVAVFVHAYLAGADPRQGLASPLYGSFAHMPAIRIHVGDDEVLLDDSRRYVANAVDAGVDARLDIWMGMAHGFPGSVGKLKAAGLAIDAVGSFLADRLGT